MHLMEEVKNDSAGCNAEGNNIGQRIKLLAYRRRDTEGSGHHAVEEVEHGTDNYHQHCIVVLSVESTANGKAAADEVAASKGVGNVSLNHLA